MPHRNRRLPQGQGTLASPSPAPRGDSWHSALPGLRPTLLSALTALAWPSGTPVWALLPGLKAVGVPALGSGETFWNLVDGFTF